MHSRPSPNTARDVPAIYDCKPPLRTNDLSPTLKPTSTPHRMPFQRLWRPCLLPLEVEERIIDHLQRSDDTEALRNCALTCRAWAVRSQFHLFRAIRVKTGIQLDALYDHFDTYPRRRTLVHSVTMAPGSSEELHYLLGVFPPALLTKLPNVRTWAIQGADDNGSKKTSSRPRALSFHKATLTQLRYSRIEQL